MPCDGYFQICQYKGKQVATLGEKDRLCQKCLDEYIRLHPGVVIEIGGIEITD